MTAHPLLPHRRFVAAIGPYQMAVMSGANGSHALIGCARKDCLWTDTLTFPGFTRDQVRAALKFPDADTVTPYEPGALTRNTVAGKPTIIKEPR